MLCSGRSSVIARLKHFNGSLCCISYHRLGTCVTATGINLLIDYMATRLDDGISSLPKKVNRSVKQRLATKQERNTVVM